MKTERKECCIFNRDGKAKANSIGALWIIKVEAFSFGTCVTSFELLLRLLSQCSYCPRIQH